MRVDPTGAVSPELIEIGVEAALQDDPDFLNDSPFTMARLRDIGLINALRLRLDALEYEWNRRVVAYDDEVQIDLLERLLGRVTEGRLLMMLVAVAGFVLLVLAILVMRGPPEHSRNAAEQAWLRLCDELARAGWPRRRGEGPLDYCRRVSAARPEWAAELQALTDHYLQMNYGSDSRAPERLRGHLQAFRRDLSRWRLRRVTPTGLH